MNKISILTVYLGDYPVGHLSHLVDDRMIFNFTDPYLEDENRPVLSQFFYNQVRNLRTDIPPTKIKAPPFFSNLLPEGILRDYLSNKAKLHVERDFGLLHLLGEDLPGAIRIVQEENNALLQTREEEQIARDEKEPSLLKFSLAGVQLKFSALMQDKLTIPAQGIGGDWIVKLPSPRFYNLPENEFAMLELAEHIGIQTPERILINVEDIQGLPDMGQSFQGKALAVKRFDRNAETRIHIEDFAQVYGVYAHYKYEKVSYTNMASAISKMMGIEQAEEFIKRLIFNILIGNADMHLKNWSLIYPDKKTPQLAPAYDYVATHVFLQNNDLALSMAGEKNIRKIDRELLKQFSAKAGLSEKTVFAVTNNTIAKTVKAWRDLKYSLPLSEIVCMTIETHLFEMAKKLS